MYFIPFADNLSMAVDQAHLIEAIVKAGTAWRDPEHEPRATAVKHTLLATNRFTAEAIAFAINQQMSLLTQQALATWVGGRSAPTSRKIGVINEGHVPMAGLQDLLAVLLTGHQYVGSLAQSSLFLLPAFVEQIQRHAKEIPVQFSSLRDLLEHVAILIAPAEFVENEPLITAWSGRLVQRATGYAVAVLDGLETEGERECLAEDVLLHEGLSRYNIRLIFAPKEVDADPYFEAFAAFRSVFPVHPYTAGALKMQQAFLAATNQPHAYGEGLAFLVSRGVPEAQLPGHIRWSTYKSLEDVSKWLANHETAVEIVVARHAVKVGVPSAIPVLSLGDAHRPALGRQAGEVDVISLLAAL